MLALSQRFNDQGEVDEGDEHHIELFESREDASESPSGSEQPTGLELLVRLGINARGIVSLSNASLTSCCLGVPVACDHRGKRLQPIVFQYPRAAVLDQRLQADAAFAGIVG